MDWLIWCKGLWNELLRKHIMYRIPLPPFPNMVQGFMEWDIGEAHYVQEICGALSAQLLMNMERSSFIFFLKQGPIFRGCAAFEGEERRWEDLSSGCCMG